MSCRHLSRVSTTKPVWISLTFHRHLEVSHWLINGNLQDRDVYYKLVIIHPTVLMGTSLGKLNMTNIKFIPIRGRNYETNLFNLKISFLLHVFENFMALSCRNQLLSGSLYYWPLSYMVGPMVGILGQLCEYLNLIWLTWNH